MNRANHINDKFCAISKYSYDELPGHQTTAWNDIKGIVFYKNH